jgi:hypothetical protein
MPNIGSSTVLSSTGLPDYQMATMPDGTKQPAVQLDDGSWSLLADRLRRERELEEEQRVFMSHFTEFKPHEAAAKTEALIKTLTKTSSHLEAYLIEILGDPDRILDPVSPLFPPRIPAHISRHICGLISCYSSASPHGKKWGQVRDLLFKKGLLQ